MKVYRLLLFVLYAASLAVVSRLALDGAPYYTTPLAERPRHELYWTLKPGGSRGQLYGEAGAAMMVLMLGYSLRKRWRWLRRWGPLRVWLDLHIYLGVMGPLLVILHTSFKVQGLVAISFWSMIAVALSGVLGRYLYLKIGCSRAGDELTPAGARLRQLFHYWHVFHKPFAFVMYVLMIVHVAVAWMTGYAWGPG